MCYQRLKEKAQLFAASTAGVPSAALLILVLGPEALVPLWIEGGPTERSPEELLEKLSSQYADLRSLTTIATCPVWDENYQGPLRQRRFSSKSTFLTSLAPLGSLSSPWFSVAPSTHPGHYPSHGTLAPVPVNCPLSFLLENSSALKSGRKSMPPQSIHPSTPALILPHYWPSRGDCG